MKAYSLRGGSLSIVNIVHGSPDQNEPRAVLYMKHVTDDSEPIALICENSDDNFYYAYLLGDGFRFIP